MQEGIWERKMAPKFPGKERESSLWEWSEGWRMNWEKALLVLSRQTVRHRETELKNMVLQRKDLTTEHNKKREDLAQHEEKKQMQKNGETEEMQRSGHRE